jgi:hypothetical protein
VKIKLERSGGITGMTLSREVDEKDLPSALIRTAKSIIKAKNLASTSVKSLPKGAADHYCYRISINDGMKQKVIECNQYNIRSDLRSLVKYIEGSKAK